MLLVLLFFCIRFRDVKNRGPGLDSARSSRTNVYRRLSISPRRRDHSGLQVDRQTVQASAAEASLTFHICFLIKIAINSFQSCLGMAPTDLLAHVKGITSSFGDGQAV